MYMIRIGGGRRITDGFSVAKGEAYHRGHRLVWWVYDHQAMAWFERDRLKDAIAAWRMRNKFLVWRNGQRDIRDAMDNW